MFRSFLGKFSPLSFKNGTLSIIIHPRIPNPSFFASIPEAKASPTIQYLVENCGLSSESAFSVSKKVSFNDVEVPDAILRLLREYEFSDQQIALTVAKHPRILAMKPETNLRPKLDFLSGIGFSRPEMASTLSLNPFILRNNLKKRIIPSILYMQKLLPKDAFLTVLKKNGTLLTSRCPVNMESLRTHGVPEENIVKAFVTSPRSMMCSPASFTKAVHKAKELGLDPRNPSFVRAVNLLTYMTQATWERKVSIYKSFGWSDEELLVMFRRQINNFAVSDQLIKKKMQFFTDKLGWDRTFILSHCVLLQMNLETRIIPRIRVLYFLKSKGLIKKKTASIWEFQLSEDSFIQKFVNKHKDSLPDVVKAYHGNVASEGLNDVLLDLYKCGTFYTEVAKP